MNRTSNRAVISAVLFVLTAALSAASAWFSMRLMDAHGTDVFWRLTGYPLWTGPTVWGLFAALVAFCGVNLSRKTIIALDLCLIALMVGTSRGTLNDVVVVFERAPLNAAVVVVGVCFVQGIIVMGSAITTGLNNRKSHAAG